MDHQAALATIEQACHDFQRPETRVAAEKTLLDFRRSANVIAAAKFILEHTRVAFAQFQAAAAIRESSMRTWNEIQQADKDALKSALVSFIVQRRGTLERYVTAQLMQTVAVIFKRGWLEDSDQAKDADRKSG